MKYTRCCLTLVMICIICPENGYAQNAYSEKSPPLKGLSLTAAIELALNDSPNYATAKKDEAAAQGNAQQSGLWENPRLFGETEEWPIDESFDQSRYFLGLSQTLPFPGKKKLERRAGEEGRMVAEASRLASRTELIKQVRVAFYRVLFLKRLLEIANGLLEVADASVRTANERLAAGASTPQEVLRAEIQFERVKSTRTQYKQDYNNSRSQLGTLLGHPELADTECRGTLKESAPRNLLKKQDDVWLAKHPLVRAAEANLGRARAVRERSDLEPYPDVTVSVSGGRREINNETLVDFGFSLPLPLIDQSKGNRAATLALQEKAQANLLRTKQLLLGQLQRRRGKLLELNEQVESYRQQLLPRSEKALLLVQTGFKEGEFGFNDLLDTQRTLAEARLVYQIKVFELNRVIAEVESLLKPNNVIRE